jgi:putative oxidoreductase
MTSAWNRCADTLGRMISHDLLAIIARVSMASVFWLSGRTKVDGGLHVSDSAVSVS